MLCNNVLEFAGNPFTVATTVDLYPDSSFTLRYNWFTRLKIWYGNLHWAWKLLIGVNLLAGAIALTILSGGSAVEVAWIIIQVAFGVGIGVATWAISTILSGGKLTGEGLLNATLDSFIVCSFFAFVSASVNYIKHISRGSLSQTIELTDDELRNFGEPGRNKGFRQVNGTHDQAMDFVRSQTSNLTELEFRVFPKPIDGYTSIRITGVERLKGIKFLWR